MSASWVFGICLYMSAAAWMPPQTDAPAAPEAPALPGPPISVPAPPARWWGLAASVLASGALAALVLQRGARALARRAPEPPGASSSFRRRLRLIEPWQPGDPAAIEAFYSEAASLVRALLVSAGEAVPAAPAQPSPAPSPPPGWATEEWIRWLLATRSHNTGRIGKIEWTLTLCDRVKFAGLRPDESTHRRFVATLRGLVDEIIIETSCSTREPSRSEAP